MDTSLTLSMTSPNDKQTLLSWLAFCLSQKTYSKFRSKFTIRLPSEPKDKSLKFVILSVAKNPYFDFMDTSLTLSMTSKPCFCRSALACLCGSAGFFERSAKSLFGLRLCARLGLAFLPCLACWLAFWANLAFWLAYSLSF